MINKLLDTITRYEGTKFMKLAGEGMDDIVPVSDLKSLEVPAIYVHVPFCRKLCPFCCFNRYLYQEDVARAYFSALKKELDMYAAKGFNFSDVYIGGGTPTILMDELQSLIAYLRKLYDIKRVSVETTPPAMTAENIDILKSCGVNRVSVGVQSFDDKVLEAMGRTIATGEEAREALARSQGQFDTVNCDFIFNFPYQPIETFLSDVRIFKEMKIAQATFYPLLPSPHKKSALERRFNRIALSPERRFYNTLLAEVYDDGYQASTAWCFSRGDRLIDEYLVDSDDYIGIGSGSVSICNGTFFVNSFSLEKYAGLIDSGRLPVVGYRRLSDSEYLRYYLLTKLFGLRVDGDKFRNLFQADISRRLGKELLALRAGGVVAGSGSRLSVTRRGMYTVSVMMREFFTSLNTLREQYIEHQV